MTTKDYLRQYRDLEREIILQREQIDELKAIAEKVSPSADSGSSGGVSDRVGKCVAKIIDIENQINANVMILAEKRREIVAIIYELENPKEREVLIRRYILGEKWERIAQAMNYNQKWIYKIHGRALQNLKIIPGNIN